MFQLRDFWNRIMKGFYLAMLMMILLSVCSSNAAGQWKMIPTILGKFVGSSADDVIRIATFESRTAPLISSAFKLTIPKTAASTLPKLNLTDDIARAIPWTRENAGRRIIGEVVVASRQGAIVQKQLIKVEAGYLKLHPDFEVVLNYHRKIPMDNMLPIHFAEISASKTSASLPAFKNSVQGLEAYYRNEANVIGSEMIGRLKALGTLSDDAVARITAPGAVPWHANPEFLNATKAALQNSTLAPVGGKSFKLTAPVFKEITERSNSLNLEIQQQLVSRGYLQPGHFVNAFEPNSKQLRALEQFIADWELPSNLSGKFGSQELVSQMQRVEAVAKNLDHQLQQINASGLIQERSLSSLARSYQKQFGVEKNVLTFAESELPTIVNTDIAILNNLKSDKIVINGVDEFLRLQTKGETTVLLQRNQGGKMVGEVWTLSNEKVSRELVSDLAVHSESVLNKSTAALSNPEVSFLRANSIVAGAEHVEFQIGNKKIPVSVVELEKWLRQADAPMPIALQREISSQSANGVKRFIAWQDDFIAKAGEMSGKDGELLTSISFEGDATRRVINPQVLASRLGNTLEGEMQVGITMNPEQALNRIAKNVTVTSGNDIALVTSKGVESYGIVSQVELNLRKAEILRYDIANLPSDKKVLMVVAHKEAASRAFLAELGTSNKAKDKLVILISCNKGKETFFNEAHLLSKGASGVFFFNQTIRTAPAKYAIVQFGARIRALKGTSIDVISEFRKSVDDAIQRYPESKIELETLFDSLLQVSIPSETENSI